jgi:hypothetical protein
MASQSRKKDEIQPVPLVFLPNEEEKGGRTDVSRARAL